MSSYLPTTLPPGWQEMRPLPRSTAIQAATADILGSVPESAHVAVVATATWYGSKLAAMVRLRDGWSFMGYVGREWSGGVSGGAELRFAR